MNQAPTPPNFQGLAREEAQATTAANRPNISTPFGAQTWTQDPRTGQWGMQTGFAGPLAGVAAGLGGQAAAGLGSPLNLGALPAMSSGQQARDQAIQAAYTQASSRLDPMWAQREEAMRTRLLGQGLDPSSEAYRSAMRDLGAQRTDAYQSAMNAAIGQGTAAGQAMFGQSLGARQQALAEALRGRTQPLEELGQLQGLLSMPGFTAARGPALLQAGMAQSSADQARWEAEQRRIADAISGGTEAATGGLQLLPYFLGGV